MSPNSYLLSKKNPFLMGLKYVGLRIYKTIGKAA